MSVVAETLALFAGTDVLVATGILGALVLRKTTPPTPQTARAATGIRPVALASTRPRPVVICPNCDGIDVQRRGFLRNRNGVVVKQRYACQQQGCGNWWSVPVDGVVQIGRAS